MLVNEGSSNILNLIEKCEVSADSVAHAAAHSVLTQVDGRCAPHLASLHPYKTPFVLCTNFSGTEKVKRCAFYVPPTNLGRYSNFWGQLF